MLAIPLGAQAKADPAAWKHEGWSKTDFQISPPLGINLFVIQSIWDGKLADVVLGTIPFHLIMFVCVAMLALWPEIALWLPDQMIVKR